MSKKFIVFILVLLVVMFAVQYRMPKRFVWEETYLHRPPAVRLLRVR